MEHVRYLVVPKSDWLSGLTYAFAVLPALWRLRKTSPGTIVHVHCAFPDAVGVALAAWILHLRYVVTAHGSDINVYAQRRILGTQVGWALRRASAVIAVSGPLAEKVKELLVIERRPCSAFRAQDTIRPFSRSVTAMRYVAP